MKNHFQNDFLVDKEKNTITIKREFKAGRQLIWDAYTTREMLDQWFAPKPLTTKTQSMDFREGGHWHYGMVEPNGTVYWGRMDYKKIQPIESYNALDGFCDETGALNPALPRANWEVSFSSLGSNSLVHNIVTYNSLADLETVIQMGLQEGMNSTMQRLDELLEKSNN